MRRRPPHTRISGRKELEAGGKPAGESPLEMIAQREVCTGWSSGQHADSNAFSIKMLCVAGAKTGVMVSSGNLF